MHLKRIAVASLVAVTGTAIGVSDAFDAPWTADVGPRSAVSLPAIAALAPTPVALPAHNPVRPVLSTESGSASYYANSLAGRRTASGVRYNPRKLIAAHRTLPFGSILRVTNDRNGHSVEVEVVDRGPFARGRVLDLSRLAAERLGFIRRGHTTVTIEVMRLGDG